MNKYEFNIEDINRIEIITLNDILLEHKIVYTRKFDEDWNDTKQFVCRYYANKDISGDSYKKICNRCGTWNQFPMNSMHIVDAAKCDKCSLDYEDIYDEDYIIDMVMSYITPNIFHTVKIIINDTEIV